MGGPIDLQPSFIKDFKACFSISSFNCSNTNTSAISVLLVQTDFGRVCTVILKISLTVVLTVLASQN